VGAGVQRVGVIGGGTMGSGIVQVFALADHDVTLVESGEELLEKAYGRVRAGIGKLVDKQKLSSENAEKALARVKRTTSLSDLKDADLVVEAVFEDRSVKTGVLERLSGALSAGAIVATNTSSISITALARASGRPDRFIGMHFFNPVPVMKLVEVIRGHATSQATFDTVMECARRLGKTPVAVMDYPGFVSNRVLMPMINEAAFCLMEGVADRDAVDAVMKLGMNHPMGPLALADFIGLDVCLDILNVLHDGFKDPKFRPCPLLVKMVAAGHLGRKTGRGFYEYRE
jgi:3-hydroxybutyryl-CoA dehydrogenase